MKKGSWWLYGKDWYRVPAGHIAIPGDRVIFNTGAHFKITLLDDSVPIQPEETIVRHIGVLMAAGSAQ